MKPLIACGLAALLLAAAAPALAAQPASRDSGRITLADLQDKHVHKLMRADADHDGRLSLAEFTTAMQHKIERKGLDPSKIQAMFHRRDVDGDGYITRADVEQLMSRRFARLDSQGRGYVTPDELRQAHQGAKHGAAADGSAAPAVEPSAPDDQPQR